MQLQKDYHHKKFRNTLFNKTGEGQKRRFWLFRNKYVNLTGILVIIFGLIYFLFFSSIFDITKVEVFGNRSIGAEEIKEIARLQATRRRLLIFKQNNLFWFDKKEFQDNLVKKYSLDAAIVKKRLFHRLKVVLSEQVGALTWISADKFYYLDLKGRVVTEVPFKDPNPDFPRLYDESSAPVKPGEIILGESQLKLILAVLDQLPFKIGEITINSFLLPTRQSNEIKAVTNQGWQIFFNTNLSADSQLDKLVLVYEKKIKQEGSTIAEYIDLRFGDRVFYK